jgi:hypothetical protein
MNSEDVTAGATRIVLDLSPGTQPIHGSLRSGTGQPEQFTGWLELTRALERMISDATQRAAQPLAHPAP